MELDIERIKRETEEGLNRSKQVLVSLFCAGLVVLGLLVYLAPVVRNEDRDLFWKVPWNVEEIQMLSNAIMNYTNESYYYILTFFCFLYLLLQSFAIPGPLILSILAGTLFGRWIGLFVVSCCATSGASLCYTLSHFFGKGLVVRKYPEKIVEANKKIQEHKNHLFFYLLFLRITPIVPNLIINLSSPILGVPFKVFFMATFFGLMPANIIHINTGMTLASIKKVGLTYDSLIFLGILAFLALIPTLFINRSKQKSP
jgi:uncharacterized membrane protein YdjX (TVP38/TMEM64 family)